MMKHHCQRKSVQLFLFLKLRRSILQKFSESGGTIFEEEKVGKKGAKEGVKKRGFFSV